MNFRKFIICIFGKTQKPVFIQFFQWIRKNWPFELIWQNIQTTWLIKCHENLYRMFCLMYHAGWSQIYFLEIEIAIAYKTPNSRRENKHHVITLYIFIKFYKTMFMLYNLPPILFLFITIYKLPCVQFEFLYFSAW